MTALTNKRQEAFAQALAKGKTISESYVIAGYQPCRQNASRLASNDDIRQRVIDLKDHHETTASDDRDPETGRFLPGNSGNGGRPKGSRNKLGEQFVSDLHEEWQRSGPAALKRVAEHDPVAFVKVVANILPSKIDTTLTINPELFQEVANFREAWRIARQYIGADDEPPMIELQPIEASHE
jgi:hypothetical protein